MSVTPECNTGGRVGGHTDLGEYATGLPIWGMGGLRLWCGMLSFLKSFNLKI